jgi:DNA-binding XRE family transcriptional regulator
MKVTARPDFAVKYAKAGLSQRKFADLAGVNWKTISDCEWGGGITRLATAWKIAKAYAIAAGIRDERAFQELFETVEGEQPRAGRPAQHTPEVLSLMQQVVELHDQGLSFNEVGKRVGYTAQWAHRLYQQAKEGA